MTWIEALIGKWRLLWGFCPYCNSDAPVLYNCPVCHYYHGSYPPDKVLRRAWWVRYKDEMVKDSFFRAK